MDTDFRRIEGEHSIRQDAAAVNTYFPQPGHTQNCGKCAAAYEMRRKGYDVEAESGEVMLLREFAAMFEEINVQSSATLSTTDSAKEMSENVERAILSWGEGARGFILGQWDDEVGVEGGHYFSAEVTGGNVLFVDGQNGKEDVKYYLAMMKPQEINYARLDNLNFTNSVKNAVKNRRR